MTPVPPPTTVRGLLDLLTPFAPAAEGEDLVFAADPPADLDAVLRVLHTGVRAALTGRRWVGCDGATGRAAALNPAAPLPAGVTLLCVEGDGRWDRIDPAARLDLPRLFARPPAPPGRATSARDNDSASDLQTPSLL
ncbi:hypothetical protein J0H58_08510 [bacterium]|nr:hypothetical protein [bacterium]